MGFAVTGSVRLIMQEVGILMRLAFTKMHGLGNDFVVINAFEQPAALSPEQLRVLANRNFGVGCDQILFVLPAPHAGVDFGYRIFNADGGEVQQCGNGARCFMRYVREHGLTDKDSVRVQTLAGIIELHLEMDGQVTVNMGVPEFSPAKIPMLADQEALLYTLDIEGEVVEISAVSMGNPHAVLQVECVDFASMHRTGPLLESHARFPERVNVCFMQVVSSVLIRLRVYERGTGETLACGTGACASVVCARRHGLVGERVSVELPGGTLIIRWQGLGSPVYMTGPAQIVYEGIIQL